jgi:hypothetical protein
VGFGIAEEPAETTKREMSCVIVFQYYDSSDPMGAKFLNELIRILALG